MIDSEKVAADIDEDHEFEIEEVPETPLTGSDDVIEQQFAKQPFRVIYQTNNFLLPQLKDLISAGNDLTLRPEYQRRLRWTLRQNSLLIESLLLNIPIPPVFFYEHELARYEVMDGQQRLNAIKEFLGNEFTLRGLEILSSLNGRSYSRLPPKIKRVLDRASISAIVLLQESQGKIQKAGGSRYYELRRFVFERLNTGGKRLTAQEIRNAIYEGHFNDQIVKLSRDDTFTRIWGIPSYKKPDPSDYYEEGERQKNALYKSMGDCQLVLRFFALAADAYIHGSMKAMLDRCMERNLDIDEKAADELGKRFLERLRFADELFNKRPFSLSLSARAYRPVAGIYDGVMVAIDRLWDKRGALLARKDDLQDAYDQLIKREATTGALTGSANTAADIKARIAVFDKLFHEFV